MICIPETRHNNGLVFQLISRESASQKNKDIEDTAEDTLLIRETENAGPWLRAALDSPGTSELNLWRSTLCDLTLWAPSSAPHRLRSAEVKWPDFTAA